MKFIKKQNLFGWFVVAAAVLALVGVIFYLVTSTTGYVALTGVAWSAAPLVCSIFAILLACVLVLYSDKLGKWGHLVLYPILALLLVSLVFFVYGRIDYFSEVYFVPIEAPVAEATAVNTSIVGFVFYFLSIAAVIVAAFGKRLYREA